MQTNLRRRFTLGLLTSSAAGLLLSGPFGCTLYANNSDFQALFSATGAAVIRAVAGNVDLGTDFNAAVRDPLTGFATSVWNNWLDSRIVDDFPNNTILLR
ncbi:MAG: hypothetical protein IPM18_10140 [Phycisphaerales bacterium]|nr:hypothetical protein [Phycisphaerales bacterium]